MAKDPRNKTGGGRGSNQYGPKGFAKQRDSNSRPSRENLLQSRAERRTPREGSALDFAYNLADIDTSRFIATSAERAAARFRARKTDLIWNDVRLEGMVFTLPEVQTLIDGVTIDAKDPAEVEVVLNLSEAANLMLDAARTGVFSLEKTESDSLHSFIGKAEAIESGHFRGEGSATGGGQVNAMGDRFMAPDPGPGGSNLIEIHRVGLSEIDQIEHPVLRAVVYSAFAIRNQFYFDANKRTSRYMMNGHLIANAYDGIVIPERRRLEYNRALHALFIEGDAQPYIEFTLSCYDDAPTE